MFLIVHLNPKWLWRFSSLSLYQEGQWRLKYLFRKCRYLTAIDDDRRLKPYTLIYFCFGVTAIDIRPDLPPNSMRIYFCFGVTAIYTRPYLPPNSKRIYFSFCFSLVQGRQCIGMWCLYKETGSDFRDWYICLRSTYRLLWCLMRKKEKIVCRHFNINICSF